MELALNDGQGDDVVIRISSTEQGFNLHDMQLGESHTLGAKDGRPVLVTRLADGYSFDVDGRRISMPLIENGKGSRQHKEVHIMRRMHGGPGAHQEGVTIISPSPLDDATRSAITSALAAAGQNEVKFINTDIMGADRDSGLPPLPPVTATDGEKVHIIRKEVRVTN